MKTKILFFLAMLLTCSMGAFAQSGNGEPLKGDLNNDGKVDAADVVTLVNIIANGGEAGGDAKYYWYAGPDMLTSETVPGTNADNECGYGWHVIESNPTSIETGDLGSSDCAKINWVFAVPTKFGLNALSNGEDVTDLYEVSTVICADGVEYYVFKQIEPSKRASLTFVKGNATSETKYYWYAGPDMLTSETVPGSGTVYPMTATSEDQIGWHKIEGTPSYIETGDLNYGEKINWVLAIPTELGLTHISNGEIVLDAYDVTTVTTADGVEYMVYKQIAASKKTSIYFVDGKTKYYLYFGTTLPTADNIASIANITEDVPEYALFEDGHRWSLRNETNESADAYICIPSVYNVIWKDENGEAIDLIDVSTFTYGSIDYRVQKLKAPLGAGEKKYIYAYNSNAGDY